MTVACRLLLAAAMCLGCIGFNRPAFADTASFGVVTWTRGQTSAQHVGLPSRGLRVGDEIAATDTLRTGSDSSMVLKLDDGTVFALPSNSELRIDVYAYDPSSRAGVLEITLNSGGVRAITGLLGSYGIVSYRIAGVETIHPSRSDVTAAVDGRDFVVAVTDGEVRLERHKMWIGAGKATSALLASAQQTRMIDAVITDASENVSSAFYGAASLTAAVDEASTGNPPLGTASRAASGEGSTSWQCFGLPSPLCAAFPIGPSGGQAPPTSPFSGPVNHTASTSAGEDAFVKADFTVVPILYGTDRRASNGGFTSSRGGMSYGWCEVTVPRNHRVGALETPEFWRITGDPSKHVLVRRIVRVELSQFLNAIADAARASSSKSAFIFIHGYNTTFEDAARRTAQIAYDLKFDGAPILYSWPSQGTVKGYPIDEANIEWTEPHLAAFILDVARTIDAQNVYLIAHSMGTRGLVRALSNVYKANPELRKRIREVILAAPDIDAEVFQRDIAPSIASQSQPITLYASSKDVALAASKDFHGYQRAGDSSGTLLLEQGVETIDASNVDTSFLGHSYYAEARTALSDMFYLVHDGLRPDQRFDLRAVTSAKGKYWRFAQ